MTPNAYSFPCTFLLLRNDSALSLFAPVRCFLSKLCVEIFKYLELGFISKYELISLTKK